ncbi:MAG TPA: hypothetical protein VGZ52_01495 [Acidimicrobiales bacterium]|nr:hypothetical protein [Acidimicrobiales bacterium]
MISLVLVDPGGSGLVISLFVAAAAGIALTWRARGFDRRWIFPAVVMALNIPHAVLLWHGSNAELGRHSLELSVSTRLALWAIVLLLTDEWLRTRADTADDMILRS